MPSLVHRQLFPIRAYECDAYGHVNNVNYLRFMQEAAFQASNAVGYDRMRYDQEGLLWLIRENEVEFIRPLRYQDQVEVRTWVADFRKVRSRRLYEFYIQGQDGLAARASTDWVMVDTKTHAPQPIPAAMIAAFAPDGDLPAPGKREPFPRPPEPPDGAVVYPRQIEFSDLDGMQHLNNANYLAIAEEVNTVVSRTYGWSLKRVLDLGFGWAARQMRIEYRGQPRLEDKIKVTSFLANPRRAGARRYYLFHDDPGGDLIAQAYVDWIFIEIATGRPARIPDQLYLDFKPNIVGEL
jgi:acyl-CoA thioester hydrolase